MKDTQYLQQLLDDTVITPKKGQLQRNQASSIELLSHQDTVYLQIWDIEQEHTKTRWTIVTFFISISFAIFGFSFQSQLAQPLPQIARISGLIIYWFSYMLFLRFNDYTNGLRKYLQVLEDSRYTTLDVQTKVRAFMQQGVRRHFSATHLLWYFGIFYTIGVGILWWFGL